MARRKDLAGLAALGALGYMLNRDSKPTEVEDRSGSNIPSTGMGEATRDPLEVANSSQDAMDIRDSLTRGAPGTSETVRPTSPRSRPRTTSMTGSGGGRGPAAGEAEAYRQRQFEEANARARTPEGRADRTKMEQAQALEAVRPEEAMIGGGGLKTVAAMARGLAGRRGTEKLAEYSVPRIGTEPLKIGTEPLKMTGPSKAELVARNRAARAAERETGRKEFNQRGVDRFVESTFEGGMKRGGKVKKMASGGMARSSASKRGDGIASKGKTKGRIY
jgi:hypothetical protein